jgi:hypothetical protein
LYLAISYIEILASAPMIFLDVVYGFVLWILSLVPPYTQTHYQPAPVERSSWPRADHVKFAGHLVYSLDLGAVFL